MTSRYPPVAQLLPHGPPMILIDELLHADAEHAVARVAITERSMFISNGAVPAVAMIEYMAQTIASHAGYNDLQRGKPIQLGFLMACRQATFTVDELQPGDELRVETAMIWAGGQVGQYACAVFRQGEQIAQARLSVFQGSLDELEQQ